MGTEHYQPRTVRMTSFDTTAYQKHRRSLPTSKLRYVKFTPVYYLLIIITSLHRQLMLFIGHTILATKYLATKSPSQGALKIVLEADSKAKTQKMLSRKTPKILNKQTLQHIKYTQTCTFPIPPILNHNTSRSYRT